MTVNFELLLQRSNTIYNKLERVCCNLEEDKLRAKPDAKSWSIIEVVQHLNLVYDIYLDNFEKTLEGCADLAEHEENKWQRTILGRLSIYSMKPRGTRRRFKMKTFDFFTPAEGNESVWETFTANKERFNEIIRRSRRLNLKGLKISTALGKKIRFYIPECLEFLIAHEERHIVQIDELLDQIEAKIPISKDEI